MNTTLHFLHIGKCAGTAIKRVMNKVNQQKGYDLFIQHPHRVTLTDLPANAAYFFSIRNPITRFYSGFYSRKRKGQPRLYVEWREEEKLAFSRFAEANDLAENLFSGGELGLHAFAAMQSIRHVRQPQHSWFPDVEEMLYKRPPICILRQEHLAEDFMFFRQAADIAESIGLEADPVKSHKNDYSKTPPLSNKAIENLEKWYAVDMMFYQLATEWIKMNQRDLGPIKTIA